MSASSRRLLARRTAPSLALLLALSAAVAGALAATALAASPAPCHGCWKPHPTTAPWQIQLQGTPRLSVRARVYELDGDATRRSTVRRLHRRGARVICYLDAGSWESYRADRDAFPPALLGKRYAGYPDERWLDIRRIDLLAPILTARLRTCREKGFDAADPDNVNGYQNDTGFGLTAADQLRFNRWLADAAHSLHLAAILKNDGSQVGNLVSWFDGSVVEQCFQFSECGLYRPFIRAGRPVYEIEYRAPSKSACAQARRRRFSLIFMRTSLSGTRRTCPAAWARASAPAPTRRSRALRSPVG